MEFQILYAINKLHNIILDNVMVIITKLGNAGWFWIVLAVILMAYKKTRKCGILMLISLLTGLLIGNVALKNIIARQRPCWIDPNITLLIPNPTDFSFPSGHTLASFEAATMIFLHNKKYGTLALSLSILIAFSWLYLFVHFPTDILGGAILGTAISIGVYQIDKFLTNKISINTGKKE